MAERVHVLGVDARAVAFALKLRQKAEVTVVADAADDLSSFNGATSIDATEHERAELQALLTAVDPSLVFAPARVVTSLGIVKEVRVRPVAALDLSQVKNAICVGFHGWREWSAHVVADGLQKSGVKTEVLNVQLHGASPDASWHQMRVRLQDVTFRDALVRALKPRLGDAQVLMPPLLGVSSTGLPMAQALGNELGVEPSRFGEAVATAPSLFGEGHRTAVLEALRARAPSSALGAELAQSRVYVFTSRARAWLSERALDKVTCHLARQSVGAGWLSGYRDAVAVESQWPR